MLEIETLVGNNYAWDDRIGILIPFSQAMKAVWDATSSEKNLSKESTINRFKGDFKEHDVVFCYDWIQKWRKIERVNDAPQINYSFSESDIKRMVLRSGLRQLVLNVTEDCNFRCKYCIYSGSSEYRRRHSKNYMNLTTAKKAIDQYIALLEEGKRFNPLRKPTLGFYGGEPLLNFDLIKECVKYINDQYYDYGITYNITTNGSLLNEYKANWLMEHGFTILVSLDGPKKEHDRNRVYINGEGTYDDVRRHISQITDTGYEKILSVATFDWKSDLFAIEEFFQQDAVPPLSIASLVESIEGHKYYEQFTEKDRLEHLKQLEMARSTYFEKFDNLTSQESQEQRESLFDKLFGSRNVGILCSARVLSWFNPVIPYTSTCIPGAKIFATVGGVFHICERVNEMLPIGDIYKGLNYKEIGKILYDYLHHMDTCNSCQLKINCNKCFASFLVGNKFLSSSVVCKEMNSYCSSLFADALSITESNPGLIDKRAWYDENIKRYSGV